MIRLFRFLGLLLALSGAPALADPAPPPLHPALWKVADADTTIYLFGTIHVLPQGQAWFTGKLAQAADSAQELVTEIGTVDPDEVADVVADLGLLPQGESLRAMMNAEDRTAYEAALARLDLPAEAFDQLEPWYAANTLMFIQLGRAGIGGVNGPEAFLDEHFASAARPRSGLETIRFQLQLFDNLPRAVQLRYLRQVVDGGASVVGEVGTITREWGQGRAEALAEAMNADSDDPAMLQALLLNRNKTWSQWIKARLERPGTVFMAVGAGHLAGRGSVQEELAAIGLTATRVQ